MMMAMQQPEINADERQVSVRRRILGSNASPVPESDVQETTRSAKSWFDEALARLKCFKEIVGTLSWLKTVVASVVGMGVVFYSSSSHTNLLAELFPQANGGAQFSWSNPDYSVKTGFDSECAKPELTNVFGFFGAASGLRLQYGVIPTMRDGGWGVHWDSTAAKHFDASGFDYFSFWVRGSSGDEVFAIGMKDADAKETKIDSKEWIVTNALKNGVEVIVPLTEFKGVNKGLLNNISISFNANQGSGSLCIDNLSFGKQSTRA
ncbi:MAG TPA: hypothetical protein DIC59_14835 [Candidatus Competibacteraceae bacterium]|nr:hypothetical protein [Candidatus Competibacteraceae bacterium]